MLENLLYPDNTNRGMRAAELVNDCDNWTSELNLMKARIDKELVKVGSTYGNALRAMGASEVPSQKLRLCRGWVYEAIPVLGGLVTTIHIERAIEKAYVRWLLSNGRIGEAAFRQFLGFPKWFRLGKFAGSAIGGTIATLVLQLGIDAVDGAVQRSKLQEAISDMSTPRFRIKKALLINQELISSLQGLSSVINVHMRLAEKDKPLAQEEKQILLDEVAKEFVLEAAERMAAINNEVVLAALAALDKARGSWLSEDKQPDTSPEIIAPETAAPVGADVA